MSDLRVLIIDDDFHVAALHVGYVNSVPGFEALPPVHDLRAVAAAVEQHAPDLVLVLSLIHISEPTRHFKRSRMPSSA